MKSTSYRLLPFRFRYLGEKVLLVNDVGEYYSLSNDEWKRLVQLKIFQDEEIFLDLSSKDFICHKYTQERINRIAAKYRTKKKYIFESTALHMFVVTHRCNQSCIYCHASSVEHLQRSPEEDMSIEVAQRCLEIVFESPSPYLKFEFQGGEPTLNFETVKYVVENAKRVNKSARKNIEFVVCTNLYNISDSQIAYLCSHDIQISTSLDGPEDMHNACRKTKSGKGTHREVIKAISRVRAISNREYISALLTVTTHNIYNLREVIDEYVLQGFGSIFIRQLNMFGLAQKRSKELHYPSTTFLDAYLDALEYIILLNRRGVFFVEEYAAILLRKILTPFEPGFVDMQSPAGAGIGAIIYDVDGAVFVSDEARMLHRETGNSKFCLGNVFEKSRDDLFSTPVMKNVIECSTLECLPGCSWCAYLPYCGSDPVRNFSLYGELVSFKPNDSWCFFYKHVFDHLFELLLSGNEDTVDILWSWATGSSYFQRRQ